MITGATGFIGSHIARRLAQSGLKVVCLVRKESSLANLEEGSEDLPIEVRYGDIRDKLSLTSALLGCNLVIHNAALVKDWGDYEDFYQTNVQGTLNILQACLENSIKDMIMTGSISVYGEENCLRAKDEDSPYNSHYRYLLDTIFPCRMNFYRDTKALAIQEAIGLAKEKRLNLTILEPVWVYGEREFQTGFYQYLRSAKSGMRFAPGSRKNKFHVVYAGDLAEAYLAACRRRLVGVNRIIIGQREAERMDRIFNLFCQEAGVRKPKRIPKWLVYPIGFLLELGYTLSRSKQPPFLTRGRVNMFYDQIEYSTKKAEEWLGFRSQYTLEEGIRRTVAWYKEHHLI